MNGETTELALFSRLSSLESKFIILSKCKEIFLTDDSVPSSTLRILFKLASLSRRFSSDVAFVKLPFFNFSMICKAICFMEPPGQSSEMLLLL